VQTIGFGRWSWKVVKRKDKKVVKRKTAKAAQVTRRSKFQFSLPVPRRILNKRKIVRATAMVELLLLSNAVPNLRAVKNERFQAALMFTSYTTNRIGVVTPLIERGADINFANSEGFTALMVAVKAS
jgi:hypothetical protein